MSKVYHEHDKAKKSLVELILQTHEVIENLKSHGDSKAISRLVFQQRHNLKVLFKQLKEAKK